MNPLASAKRMVDKAYRAAKKLPKAMSPEEADLVGMVVRRCDDSMTWRRDQEGQWAIAMSYLRSSQWVEFKFGTVQDVRDPENYFNYKTVNVIRPLIDRAAARACARRPDVAILPRSKSNLDRQAQEEIESAIGHYDSKLASQDILRMAVYYSLLCTTAYSKNHWNPYANAEVPIERDKETGEVVRYGWRQVGDLVEEFVPGHEVYLDPQARNFHGSRWVIHARRVPSETLEELYGCSVMSDAVGRQFSVVDLVRQQVSPFLTPPSDRDDNLTTVYEYYERPCPRYPDGRTICCTPSQMLYCGDSLPVGGMPFVPLGFIEDPFSPYDRGIGTDLCEMQSTLNGAWSQAMSMLANQKRIIIRSRTDGSGADLKQRFNETQDTLEIFYNPNEAPPTVMLPPMPTADLMTWIEKMERLMGDISGVHDVSQGTPTPDAKSGVAIRMLQDSDQQMMALYHQRVEQFCKERAELRMRILAERVREPRVWSVDTNLNEHKVSVSALPALTRGGTAAVFVQPGSGTPRLPEMQDEQVLMLYSQGIMGQPGTPEASRVALKAMQSPAAARVAKIIEQDQEEAMEQAASRAIIESQVDQVMGQGGGDILGQGDPERIDQQIPTQDPAGQMPGGM